MRQRKRLTPHECNACTKSHLVGSDIVSTHGQAGCDGPSGEAKLLADAMRAEVSTPFVLTEADFPLRLQVRQVTLLPPSSHDHPWADGSAGWGEVWTRESA